MSRMKELLMWANERGLCDQEGRSTYSESEILEMYKQAEREGTLDSHAASDPVILERLTAWTISLYSCSGKLKGTALLVRWSDPVERWHHTNSSSATYDYRRGTDADGDEYETVARSIFRGVVRTVWRKVERARDTSGDHHLASAYDQILKTAATVSSDRELQRLVFVGRAMMVPAGLRTRSQVMSEVRAAAGGMQAIAERR